MKDLFLWTFNCAKFFIKSDELQELISASFTGQQIAVFAFQEVCPIVDACLGMQKPYVDLIHTSIENALGSQYTRVDTVSMGAVLLVVYISTSEASHSTASVMNGLWRSSLKGAAGMRLQLADNEEFTFVAAHLSAGEGFARLRNQDYYDVVTRLDFGDGYGAYKPGTHLFFLGDLNYRSVSDPFSSGDNLELQSQSLLSMNRPDELIREMKSDRCFHGMTEAEIEFKPTYKFIVGSTEIYNKHRIASWCDRVLFKHYLHHQVNAYKSLPTATSSDHKPVYLSISVGEPIECISNDAYYRHVNLGLDSKRHAYRLYGEVSDKLIGYGMFVSSTKTGLAYVLAGTISLCVVYLFMTW